MEKKTANKKHRKYDENFKSEVLKMTKTRSVAEVARSMGIGENLLYKWRSDEKTKETPAESEVNVEIEQLRKQVRQLETERDVLKKALVIFGRGT
jgi:transposase